jgi:hemolysin activation/secretion protein
MSDLPGLSVRTVIRPSPSETGAAELVIIATRKEFGGSLQADNLGSTAIGPQQFSATLQANSLLGLDEQTTVLGATAAHSSQLAFVSVAHDEILDAEGLKLSLKGSYSHSRPGGTLAALNPLGEGETGSAFLSAPLIRTRTHSLTVSGGFTFENNRLDLLDVRFNEDRVRYLSLGATYDFSDTALSYRMPGLTVLRIQVDQGLNILDATTTGSPDLSRAKGHSDFTVVYAEATRVQALSPQVSVALAAAGQWSATQLLVSQQFGLGGQRFGRGYEPSELIGDEGLAGSVEARYDPFWLRVRDVQPEFYGFFDTGVVWAKDASFGQPRSESLSSAGVGLRFDISHHLSVELELAKPLTRAIASRGNKDVRPLFSVSTSF